MSKDSQEVFTAAIEPHFDRLYRLAYRLAGSKSNAEDLLQDVLTKLYERRDELSSIRDLAPWLGRVLYNQFIDGQRRYGRQPVRLVSEVEQISLDDDIGRPAADANNEPDISAYRAEQLQILQHAVDRLSEDHRIVLLMHDTEGYTLNEIQELTGTPVGTLKSRLHRARFRARELLGDSLRPATQPQKELEPFSSSHRVDR